MIPGLSIIDDILKGLPENARLRSQLGELRTQIEALQSQLKDAHAEIERFRKQQQPASAVDDQAAQFLVAIANAPEGAKTEDLFAHFRLSPAKGDFHFDQLRAHKFVYQASVNMFTGIRWGATPSGREFLNQKGLL
jgi:hypothetical protein